MLFMSPYLTPILLLVGSNVFMTTAWYWHLRYKDVPLIYVIFISWGLAFVEYCLAVPANRFGSAVYNAAQLKTIQEVITFVVFAAFSYVYLREPITLSSGLRLCVDRGRRILCISQVVIYFAGTMRRMRPDELSVSR